MSPATLVEIFYGLAIGSGIEHVGERLFGGERVAIRILLPLSLGAFAAAIGDWLVYYKSIAPHPYRRVGRLLLDIVIVTTIFFLFKAAESPLAYVCLMTGYFFLGTL